MKLENNYEYNGYTLSVKTDGKKSGTVIEGYINDNCVISVYIDEEGTPKIGSSSCLPSDFKKAEAMIHLNTLVVSAVKNIMSYFQ